MQEAYVSIGNTPTGIKSNFTAKIESCLPDWVTKEWVIYKGVPLLILGVGAATASVLIFIEPCKNYALSSDLGIWLTEKLGFSSWYIFFASSAPDIAMLNGYAAMVFVDKYNAFMQKIPTRAARVMTRLSLLGFSIVQLAQPFAVASGTGSSLMTTGLATFGFVPMTLYVGMNSAKEDLPWIFYYLNSARIGLQQKTFGLINALRPPVQIQNYHVARKNIEVLGDATRNIIQTKWLNILQHKVNIDFSSISPEMSLKEKLQFILMPTLIRTPPNQSEKKDSYRPLSVLSMTALRLLAGALVFSFLYSDVRNLITIMTEYLFFTFMAYTIGSLASITIVYFISSFVSNFMVNAGAYLWGKIFDKPIDWLPYHLSPNFARVATFFNFLSPLLSYPLALKIFELNYNLSDEDSINYKSAWASSIATIVLYHILGQVKMTGRLQTDFLKIWGNHEQKALIVLGEALHELLVMMPEELIKVLDKLSKDQKDSLTKQMHIKINDRRTDAEGASDFIEEVKQDYDRCKVQYLNYKNTSSMIRKLKDCCWRADPEEQVLLQTSHSAEVG